MSDLFEIIQIGSGFEGFAPIAAKFYWFTGIFKFYYWIFAFLKIMCFKLISSPVFASHIHKSIWNIQEV
jgi:hypothetical protein